MVARYTGNVETPYKTCLRRFMTVVTMLHTFSVFRSTIFANSSGRYICVGVKIEGVGLRVQGVEFRV